MERTTATLLRTYELSETSLIVHWCSRDLGVLKTVARAARSPKSPFAGKLDLFFENELVIVPSRRSDLHVLKETVVLHTREGIRRSYVSTLAAAYFVRWIEMIAEPEASIPQLAELLQRALDYLNEEPPSRRVVERFEMRLAQFTGLYEPGRDPVQDLADNFGSIPAQREELGRLLPPEANN